ncbi:MAG: hypothetical protein IJU54_00115 [Alphaproteobacteria bacterium]|nr:hypothetical protein [Alphaproteobacteria bacterium]
MNLNKILFYIVFTTIINSNYVYATEINNSMQYDQEGNINNEKFHYLDNIISFEEEDTKLDITENTSNIKSKCNNIANEFVQQGTNVLQSEKQNSSILFFTPQDKHITQNDTNVVINNNLNNIRNTSKIENNENIINNDISINKSSNNNIFNEESNLTLNTRNKFSLPINTKDYIPTKYKKYDFLQKQYPNNTISDSQFFTNTTNTPQDTSLALLQMTLTNIENKLNNIINTQNAASYQITMLQNSVIDINERLNRAHNNVSNTIEKTARSINSNNTNISRNLKNELQNITEIRKSELSSELKDINQKIDSIQQLIDGTVVNKYLYFMNKNISVVFSNIKDDTRSQFKNIPGRLEGMYNEQMQEHRMLDEVNSKLDELITQINKRKNDINGFKKEEINNNDNDNINASVKLDNKINQENINIKDKDKITTQIEDKENKIDEIKKYNEIPQNIISDKASNKEESKNITNTNTEDRIVTNKIDEPAEIRIIENK